MNRIRCVDTTAMAFVGILFCIVGATSQVVITPTTNLALNNISSEFNMTAYNKICECIKYNCGCCQHLEWDVISMNGKLCVNASYLEKDYGVSLTVTYNNFTVFNETISARNPPPICLGEEIIDYVDVEVCLHIYDINIDIDIDKFHVCFEILGEILKLKVTKIRLGCIQPKLHNKMETNLSQLFFKKTENDTLSNTSIQNAPCLFLSFLCYICIIKFHLM